MMMMNNNNMVIIKLAIKYDPPTLALFYKLNKKDRKKRRYNIFLNQLAFLPTPQDITEQLYCEHKHFLNDYNVDYDQIVKMVDLIFRNFQNPAPLLHSQDSDDKSIQFENDEQLYYSSYDPRKDVKNVLRTERLVDLNETTPSNRQRITSAMSPKYLNSKPSTADHLVDSEDLQWSGKHNTSQNNLNLSLSGMQQFMQISGGGKMTQKPVYKSQRSNSSSPVIMPKLSLQDTSMTNVNLLNNRQQQQLRNKQYSDEANMSVEQSPPQMFIDDQQYESPPPPPPVKGSKYAQQQLIENQQQYYLQQNGYSPQQPKKKNSLY